MATKLSAEKLLSRYQKSSEQLASIDSRKAKAQNVLDTIEGEREEITLKQKLQRVQYLSAGGDPALLDAPVEASDEDADETEDDTDEDDTDEDDDFES